MKTLPISTENGAASAYFAVNHDAFDAESEEFSDMQRWPPLSSVQTGPHTRRCREQSNKKIGLKLVITELTVKVPHEEHFVKPCACTNPHAGSRSGQQQRR